MKKSHHIRTLLVSAPFLFQNAPPAGIGTLKSVMAAEGFSADTLYLPLYLSQFMGEASYNHFAFNPRASEMLYACCLFPEMEKRSKTHLAYRNYIKPRYANPFYLPEEHYDLSRLLELIRHFNDLVRADLSKRRYDVVGFSLVTNQVLASLFFSKMYKDLHPDSAIAFGGPLCTGEAGKSYIRTFPWIDYLVDGEGEVTFIEVLNNIERNADKPIAGCSYRSGDRIIKGPPRPYNTKLDKLPVPDYQDYIDIAQGLERPIAIDYLPIEMSRGCWWNRCVFCDCPYFHKTYRHLSPKRIRSTMDELSRRHSVLKFLATDLVASDTSSPAKELASSKRDYRFFLEFRPSVSPKELREMKEAGLSRSFFGIESLSTSLLKKMKKGTTTIQNIQALRHAALCDIDIDNNLIYDYPGETKAEFEETLENLKRCWHYLGKFYETRFALARGSYAFENLDELKITSVRPHPLYTHLFPKKIRDQLAILIFDFTTSYRLHGPYRDALTAQGWVGSSHPKLSYLDGKDFMIVYDMRGADREGMYNYRRLTISNPVRKLLLYCDRIRSIREIQKRFGKLRKKEIADVLDDLCENNLLFHEDGLYLSLVMPEKASFSSPNA